LATDFGKGSAISGDEYFKNLKSNYDDLKNMCIERNIDFKKRVSAFKYPHMPDIRLNYMNEKVDDDFACNVLNTSQCYGSYPAKQITDPSENFWNGEIDP